MQENSHHVAFVVVKVGARLFVVLMLCCHCDELTGMVQGRKPATVNTVHKSFCIVSFMLTQKLKTQRVSTNNQQGTNTNGSDG